PLGDRSVGQPRSVAGLPGNWKVLVNYDRVWTGEVGIGAGDQFVVRIDGPGGQQGPAVIHSSVEQAGNGCALQRHDEQTQKTKYRRMGGKSGKFHRALRSEYCWTAWCSKSL